MTHAHTTKHRASSLTTRTAALLAALIALGLLAASPASASYEQVGCFAGSFPGLKESCKPTKEGPSEEVQLGGVSGMAVNSSGAGGVPAGTLYAIGSTLSYGPWVSVYEPAPDGGLTFVEAWQWSLHPRPTTRCGPALPTSCPPKVESQPLGFDVDVDQSTGNVYVLAAAEAHETGQKVVTEYEPDGEEITRFGEFEGEFGHVKPTSESPDKVHESEAGGLAIDAAGNAYVFDLNGFDNFYHRLMEFKPCTPGDYSSYCYAGAEHDIGAGFQGETPFPTQPAIDDAGHIYTIAGERSIQEFDPNQSLSTPICSFEFAKQGIYAMAVNPTTGEVFFYSYRDKKVHRLAPCSEGAFKETESFGLAPERSGIKAMAFDPLRKVDPTRAPGTLYAGAPTPIPAAGVGKGEPGQSALGYVFAQVLEISPEVVSESVAHVTQSTATISAEVNPEGSETRYAFQYLTQAEYEAAGESFQGATETPVGGAVLGSGPDPLSAVAALTNLSPDTEYLFRVVATSHCSVANPEKACEATGSAKRFRTFPEEAPTLPDHRAWELVSPPDKQGGQVFVADRDISSCTQAECKPGIDVARPMQSAPDGEAVVYAGRPFVQGQGGLVANEYISRRNEKTGWQTTNLTPQLVNSGEAGGFQAFDPSLTRGVLFQQGDPTLSPEAPSGTSNLYLQPTSDPSSISSFLTQEPPHRSGTGPEQFRLSFAGGSADFSKLFFAANDALTEETPFAPEAVDGGPSKSNLYELTEGQLRLVNVLPGNAETSPGASIPAGGISAHAISNDGSRVFWTSEAGQLYVREGGEVTKEIPDPGKFLSASADGSKVLLTDGHLYDLETEATTDLSEGKGGFLGIAGQSEDLSTIYFVDSAALAPGAEDRKCESATEGNQGGAQYKEEQEGRTPAGFGCNLYAWHEGETSFIATLQANDGNGTSTGSDWESLPLHRTAEASADGRYLAFLSRVSLSGYDSRGPCGQGPCEEAFLYDSATGELRCASCNPTGVPPLGSSTLRLIAGVPSAALPQARYLTNTGRLYFDSRDSLSPSDTNEGVEDVYQYEPPGAGALDTCKREAGCLNLISAGHEAYDSNFLSMSEDGSDVFFTTRDQLTLKDKDQLYDLYDAREGGGIPSESEVARSECQGEACQPLYTAPNDPTPASSSFEGAGNVHEAGKAKRHKHKKRHAKRHKRAKEHRRAKHDRGGVR